MNEYLEKRQHPDSYAGHSPVEDYVIYTRHRDCTILENCNYELILLELNNLSDSLHSPGDGENWVYDFRASHWAVGWVETIIVRADAPLPLIELAESIVCALADYPVYSDGAYSDAQYTEIHQYWERIGMRERIELCADAGESIFAAREEIAPEGVFDDLLSSEAFY